MLVKVKEIGSIEGMVDTGAKTTGVSLGYLNDEAEIRASTKTYLTVDGNHITNVVGETDLTVTFQGKDVWLPNVAVFKEMVYPLVLGIDWITRGNIVIIGREGGALVSVSNQVITEKLPSDNGTSVKEEFVPAEFTRYTIEDVKRKFEEMEALSEDNEEVEENATPELVQDSAPLQGIGSETVFDVARTFTEIEAPGAVGPTSKKISPGSEKLNKEDVVIGMFKPDKETIIPENSWKYVKGRAPGMKSGTWIVSKTLSSKGPKCWVIPSCLVKAEEGRLWIPIINVGLGLCKTKDLLKKIRMEWVGELNTVPVADDSSTFAVLQPEWENEVLALEDLNVNPNLSSEQRTSVKNVLREHSRLFPKAK